MTKMITWILYVISLVDENWSSDALRNVFKVTQLINGRTVFWTQVGLTKVHTFISIMFVFVLTHANLMWNSRGAPEYHGYYEIRPVLQPSSPISSMVQSSYIAFIPRWIQSFCPHLWRSFFPLTFYSYQLPDPEHARTCTHTIEWGIWRAFSVEVSIVFDSQYSLVLEGKPEVWWSSAVPVATTATWCHCWNTGRPAAPMLSPLSPKLGVGLPTSTLPP